MPTAGRANAVPPGICSWHYHARWRFAYAGLLRNDDIKFLFQNVPVGTRVQFIDEPVKATTEPDGSRYIEVHNPLSTTEAQFDGKEIVPITLTKSVQGITSQTDVDQSVVEQAIQNRSGMPVRLN